MCDRDSTKTNRPSPALASASLSLSLSYLTIIHLVCITRRSYIRRFERRWTTWTGQTPCSIPDLPLSWLPPMAISVRAARFLSSGGIGPASEKVNRNLQEWSFQVCSWIHKPHPAGAGKP